jgi:hypothetical protein
VNQDFLSHGHAQMQTEKYATIDPPPGLESQAMFKFRHLMDENQRFDKLLPYSSASYPLPSETETASELAENLSSSLHLSNNSFIHQQQQPHKTPPRMSSSAHKHYSNYMSSQNEYPQQNGFIYPSRMQGTTGQNSIYPPNYCSSYTSESQLSSSNVLERQGLPSQNRTFDNFSQNRLQNSTHQFVKILFKHVF